MAIASLRGCGQSELRYSPRRVSILEGALWNRGLISGEI